MPWNVIGISHIAFFIMQINLPQKKFTANLLQSGLCFIYFLYNLSLLNFKHGSLVLLFLLDYFIESMDNNYVTKSIPNNYLLSHKVEFNAIIISIK